MKPSVQKLSSVLRTALLCCPSCYRMVSYSRDAAQVECPACGTTLYASPETLR